MKLTDERRQALSAALKEARLRRNWSLEKMAQWLSVSKGTVFNLESGRGRWQERTLYRVYGAFPELEGSHE